MKRCNSYNFLPRIQNFPFEKSRRIATIMWFPKLPKEKISGYFIDINKFDLEATEVILKNRIKKKVKPFVFIEKLKDIIILLKQFGGYIYCPYNIKNNTIQTCIYGKSYSYEKLSDATLRLTNKYFNKNFKLDLRPIVTININKICICYISFIKVLYVK